jgi:hypothetical protein
MEIRETRDEGDGTMIKLADAPNMVEFIHPTRGIRTIGMVVNTFKNGKFQVRPFFTRNGNQVSSIQGTWPYVNVLAGRCEAYTGPTC